MDYSIENCHCILMHDFSLERALSVFSLGGRKQERMYTEPFPYQLGLEL